MRGDEESKNIWGSMCRHRQLWWRMQHWKMNMYISYNHLVLLSYSFLFLIPLIYPDSYVLFSDSSSLTYIQNKGLRQDILKKSKIDQLQGLREPLPGYVHVLGPVIFSIIGSGTLGGFLELTSALSYFLVVYPGAQKYGHLPSFQFFLISFLWICANSYHNPQKVDRWPHSPS